MTLYHPDPEAEANLPVKSNIVEGEHVPVHDVNSLPEEFTDNTTAIKTAVQALSALVSGGRFAVELSATLIGYLANLSSLSTLATIAANQGVPSGGPKFGYKGGITTSGPYQFASKVLSRGCAVTNLDATNNLLISVGSPGATDVDTYTVRPGATSPFIAVSNANGFNMLSSAGTIAACYAGA